MKCIVLTFLIWGLMCATASANAQPTITVSPATEPFEASVASAVTLTFNVQVHDGEGAPVALTEQVMVEVEVPAWTDAEEQVSVALAQYTWTLPQGFDGGQRAIAIAVTGMPPSEPLTGNLVLNVTIGQGDPVEIPVVIEVGPGLDYVRTYLDFTVTPDQGTNWGYPLAYSGNVPRELRLFRDFGAVTAVGVISALNGDAETVATSVTLRVVEVVDGEEVTTSVLETADTQFSAMDLDENGIAEFIQTSFTLQAPLAVAVNPNEWREFLLYARRTDLDPVLDILLAEIRVEARGGWSHSGFALDDPDQRVYFERRQSNPLANPRPFLYVNDVLLGDAAQATAVVEPGSGNSTPDSSSGLYDLAWTVVIDWPALKDRAVVVAGDTFRVDLTFPGTSMAAISAAVEVLEPGVEITTFRKLSDLEDEEYDNGKTEKDYLDELLDDLKAAGVKIENGGVSFPDGFPEVPAHPQWKDIDDALEKLRQAINDWKNKPRKKNGQDQLEGKREFRIDVFIEVDGILIRVILVIGDGTSRTTVDDTARHPDEDGDNKDVPRIAIGAGKDGKNHGPGQEARKGANAPVVEVKKRGSLGVAIGGDGGNGGTGEPDPDGVPGADGGNSEVMVDTKRDAGNSKNPSTGISIGGRGGNSNGTAGSGGDSKSEAKQGSKADIISKAGDTGESKLPKPGLRPRSGTSQVRNEDSDHGQAAARTKHAANDVLSGTGKGGISVAQSDQGASTAPPQPPKPSGTTTPSGG
jgi:hypothetical protein